MKTSIILLALFGLSFTYDSGNAKADKVQGIDVFVYSEPLEDYEVIESGKVIATLTGSCNEQVNASIKKAAKAGANGVIIHLESSRWEAIKYK
jgi:hypothetical protein